MVYTFLREKEEYDQNKRLVGFADDGLEPFSSFAITTLLEIIWDKNLIRAFQQAITLIHRY